MYNTVLLTIGTMLHSRSPERIHLQKGNFMPIKWALLHRPALLVKSVELLEVQVPQLPVTEAWLHSLCDLWASYLISLCLTYLFYKENYICHIFCMYMYVYMCIYITYVCIYVFYIWMCICIYVLYVCMWQIEEMPRR